MQLVVANFFQSSITLPSQTLLPNNLGLCYALNGTDKFLP